MKSVLFLQNEILEYRKPVYNGLAAHYDIAVFHSGRPSITTKDRYHEIITPQIGLGPFYIQPRSSLAVYLGRFDVVVAMFDLRWPAYLLPLLGRRRSKYILWGHRYGGNRLANAIRDSLMKKADRLLMYGDEEVERMIEGGVERAKIVLAPNTIHVPNHRDHSAAPKSSLLFVGRFQPLKRIDLIIEAFAKLQGRISADIVLEIVGNGAIEPALRQLAVDLGVSHKVVFHGRVDDPDALSKLFSRAYAYVSPSPVGLGALHSCAYGVPVLTIREVRHGPEFHRLTHNHDAIICDDMREMEQVIEKICSDPAFSAELGRNAYQLYAREGTLDMMLAGFRQAIDD